MQSSNVTTHIRDQRYFAGALALLVSIVLVVSAGAQPTPEKTTGQSNTISLQLKSIELSDVFRTLSDQSEYNIVAADDVKGRATLFLEEVTLREAIDLIANLYNLAYVIDGKTIIFYTSQTYEDMYGRKFSNLARTKVFRLQHVRADQIINQLNAIKSKDGMVITDARTNSLIVFDVPGVLDQFAEIIALLDVPVETRLFGLSYSSPAAIHELIKPFLGSTSSVIKDEAGQQLIITDAPGNLDKIAGIIGQYDTPPALQTREYELAYTKAADLATKLTGELTPNVGKVIADEASNRLVITDLPASLDRVEDILRAFDRMPREIMIEAKIIQISLDKSTKLGVNWRVVADDISELDARARFNILSENDDGLIVTSDRLEQENYEAVVEMLAEQGKTDLLSAPRLLVANNTEARILVGSTVPYKTVDTREDNGAIRTFERVTQVEVGVKLYVTPVINGDSVVTLRIRPEVSSVTGFSDNVPIVEKSETETVVIAKNGSTILIGGLVKEETRKTQKGIPILSNIPLLGMLFRSTDNQKVKTELAILLTPHIISGRLDDLQQTPAGDTAVSRQ